MWSRLALTRSVKISVAFFAEIFSCMVTRRGNARDIGEKPSGNTCAVNGGDAYASARAAGHTFDAIRRPWLARLSRGDKVDAAARPWGVVVRGDIAERPITRRHTWHLRLSVVSSSHLVVTARLLVPDRRAAKRPCAVMGAEFYPIRARLSPKTSIPEDTNQTTRIAYIEIMFYEMAKLAAANLFNHRTCFAAA